MCDVVCKLYSRPSLTPADEMTQPETKPIVSEGGGVLGFIDRGPGTGTALLTDPAAPRKSKSATSASDKCVVPLALVVVVFTHMQYSGPKHASKKGRAKCFPFSGHCFNGTPKGENTRWGGGRGAH